jgi:hypothetical protein
MGLFLIIRGSQVQVLSGAQFIKSLKSIVYNGFRGFFILSKKSRFKYGLNIFGIFGFMSQNTEGYQI